MHPADNVGRIFSIQKINIMIIKSQVISRKALYTLSQSCPNCAKWQKEIAAVLLEQQTSTSLKITTELITEAYSEADDSQKSLLKKYFKLEFPKKITDRISNFQDVLKIAGQTLDDILPYQGVKSLTKKQKSQNALAKIQLITEVYNEGTVIDFDNPGQNKYYSWWNKNKIRGRWVFYGVLYCHSSAVGGFGSYFVSDELCWDAANKFSDIYNDYLP